MREEIKELGVTYAEVARAAGLNERQLRRRLSGETAFKAHELLAISAWMDCPTGEVAA
jgi:hypothetical protein